MEPSQQTQNTQNIKRNKNKKKQKKKGQVVQYPKSQDSTTEQKADQQSQNQSQDGKLNTSYGSRGHTNNSYKNSARSRHSNNNSYNSGSQRSSSPKQNRERRNSGGGRTLAKEIKDSLTSIVGQIVDLQEDPILNNSDSKNSEKKADKDIPTKIHKQRSHNSNSNPNQWSDKQLNENENTKKGDKKKPFNKHNNNNDQYYQQPYYNQNSGYDNYYNHPRGATNSQYHKNNGGSYSNSQYNQYNKQNQGQAYYDYSYGGYGRQDQYNDGRREVYYDDDYSRYHHPQQSGYNNQTQQNQYQGKGQNNRDYQNYQRHDSMRYEERKSMHESRQQDKAEDPSIPKIQYVSGKPIFMVDWDSDSMESYQSVESEDESSPDINNQVHFDEYGNQIQMYVNPKPIIVMQSRRNGFLEQYIYSQEELEEMKMQQQQKEMSMKPWERDLQEMERYFLKMQEDENLKLNSTIDSQKIIGNMALIQQLKDTQRKEIMAQYFNYGFQEESFKAYINKQIQKFFDQSRITQVIQNQQESKDSKHETSAHKKQVILNYLQYQEQQSQRDYYKQVREDLHQQQNIMQQQIQVQLQQQQQTIQMQQQMQQMTLHHNQQFQQEKTQKQGGQQQQPAVPAQQQQQPQAPQYFQLNNSQVDKQIDPMTMQQQTYVQQPPRDDHFRGNNKSPNNQSQLQHMQTLLNSQAELVPQNQFITPSPRQEMSSFQPIQTKIKSEIAQPPEQNTKNVDHMGKAALAAKPFIPHFK